MPTEIRIEKYLTDAKTRGLGLHLSSYDVPRTGKVDFDKLAGVLNIDFEYIDQEPFSERELADHIYVKVGKNSGKIIGFAIPVERYKIGEVRLTISNALEAVDRALEQKIPKLKRFNQRENYELVRSVLNQNRSLMEATAAAL